MSSRIQTVRIDQREREERILASMPCLLRSAEAKRRQPSARTTGGRARA